MGGIAAGLSIPSFGISVVTAGTTAVTLGFVSFIFHGGAVVIDIFYEENKEDEG